MWLTERSPQAQQIIDRLAAINYEQPNIDEPRIRDAFSRHLIALNQCDRPVEIYRSFYTAFDPAWEVMFFDTTQWLLEELNVELRRVLIQGIGYDRICQELQTTELGSWREYTLLKIDTHVDIEPIHLLKMTCPNTNRIHVLRIPPDITSVREAIAWCNWEIDPEQFSVES